ncbi:hypothetical protein C4564_02345 [Candidatus Microgenomates bacterium]|nr:MAG: hypothetical protein C4564_02345 [Candidatus Microgenomates bacterium]
MTKSSSGLKKETAAALSYLFGPFTGFVFLLLETDEFVRFHAMQSIIVLGGLGLGAMLFSIIPFVNSLLWVGYVLVLLIGMYKASQGEKWTNPVIGKIVRSLLKL